MVSSCITSGRKIDELCNKLLYLASKKLVAAISVGHLDSLGHLERALVLIEWCEVAGREVANSIGCIQGAHLPPVAFTSVEHHDQLACAELYLVGSLGQVIVKDNVSAGWRRCRLLVGCYRRRCLLLRHLTGVIVIWRRCSVMRRTGGVERLVSNSMRDVQLGLPSRNTSSC